MDKTNGERCFASDGKVALRATGEVEGEEGGIPVSVNSGNTLG